MDFILLYFHLFVIDAVHLKDISDVIHRYSLTLLQKKRVFQANCKHKCLYDSKWLIQGQWKTCCLFFANISSIFSNLVNSKHCSLFMFQIFKKVPTLNYLENFKKFNSLIFENLLASRRCLITRKAIFRYKRIPEREDIFDGSFFVFARRYLVHTDNCQHKSTKVIHYCSETSLVVCVLLSTLDRQEQPGWRA